jgi:phosphoenolpyruvate carboxylase
MMPDKTNNIQEESSYKRKEEAYKKHLQRLQDHLLKTAPQSETKPDQKFGSEPVKTKAPYVQGNQLRN